MSRAKETAFKAALSDLFELSKPKLPWLTNKPISRGDTSSPLSIAFCALGGNFEGLERKRQMRLSPDAFVPKLNRIVEFDEVQHFTKERAITLGYYPWETRLGFSLAHYRKLCEVHGEKAQSKGAAGYRRRTDEFDFAGGRHAQRAFFDMAKDLLCVQNGLNPVLRISEFELPDLERMSFEESVLGVKHVMDERLSWSS